MPSSMINSEFKKLAIIDHTLYHYMIYIFIFYIRKNKLCSIFYIKIISLKEIKKKKKQQKQNNRIPLLLIFGHCSYKKEGSL